MPAPSQSTVWPGAGGVTQTEDSRC